MTNKDMINSILNDTDTNKFVDFLINSPCEHCYYWREAHCQYCGIDKELTDVCMEGIKKWLESEVKQDESY